MEGMCHLRTIFGPYVMNTHEIPGRQEQDKTKEAHGKEKLFEVVIQTIEDYIEQA